eukprot:6196624-Pleurochrysis_carterae.AAC.1
MVVKYYEGLKAEADRAAAVRPQRTSSAAASSPPRRSSNSRPKKRKQRGGCCLLLLFTTAMHVSRHTTRPRWTTPRMTCRQRLPGRTCPGTRAGLPEGQKGAAHRGPV